MSSKHGINLGMAVAVICIVALLGSILGYWSLPFLPSGGGGQQITPTPTPYNGGTNNPTPVPQGTSTSAHLVWNIRDAMTKVSTDSGDTAYVSIAKADANGYFDFLVPMEETEFDAAPDTAAGIYTTGDELILAVSSDNDPTGGNETYPRWFYIQSLGQGAPIKALPLVNPISALTEYSGGTGSYVYKVNGAVCTQTGTVALTSGTTPTWDLGYLELYGRVGLSNLISQHTNKGVVGSTFSDGATWEDTDGEINANYTFTADTEDINVELIGEVANVAYGIPSLAVTSVGKVKQYNAVLIFATDATAVTTSELTNDGWQLINKPDMTADVAFYYVINPVTDGGIPGVGDVINIRIPVTITDTGLAGSTEYEFETWALDWQSVDDVARGATTITVPTGNGFLTEVGSDAVINPRALTISSGSTATPHNMGHFTTN